MRKSLVGIAILLSLLTVVQAATCFTTTIAIDQISIALGDTVATSATFTNCGNPSDIKRVLIQITATCDCYDTNPLVDIFLGESTINAGRTYSAAANFKPPVAGVWIVSADVWTRNNIHLAGSSVSLTVQ